MNENAKITIRGHSDIINARMRVRRLARTAGLNTADQARIALATSSLAQTLRMGEKYQGEIAIQSMQGGSKDGVRIVCTIFSAADCEPTLKALKDTKWMLMVDELRVETLPSSNLEVTAIKWAA